MPVFRVSRALQVSEYYGIFDDFSWIWYVTSPANLQFYWYILAVSSAFLCIYILCNLYNLVWIVCPQLGVMYRIVRKYQEVMDEPVLPPSRGRSFSKAANATNAASMAASATLSGVAFKIFSFSTLMCSSTARYPPKISCSKAHQLRNWHSFSHTQQTLWRIRPVVWQLTQSTPQPEVRPTCLATPLEAPKPSYQILPGKLKHKFTSCEEI